MAFSGFDWIIIAIIGFSTVIGLFVGFLRSILSVLVWVGAVVASMVIGPQLANSFSVVTNNPSFQLWLSYGVVFIAATLIGWVVKLVVGLIFIGSRPSGINQLLGALFGFIRGLLLVVVLMWFVVLAGLQNTAFFKGMLTPYFLGMTNAVVALFPNATEALENSMSSLKSGTQGLSSGIGGMASGIGGGSSSSGIGGLMSGSGGSGGWLSSVQSGFSQLTSTVKSNLSGI